MKNLKIIGKIISLVFCLSILAACGSDPIADDLKSYVNDKLPAIQALENKALDAYNAVAGKNYKDDATMIAAVNNTVIPASNEALANAKKLAPTTKEVASLNEKYIAALTSYNSAYIMVKNAIDSADEKKVDKANALFDTAEKQDEEYSKALSELAKAHGLELTDK